MNAKLLLQGLVLATSLVVLPEVSFAQNNRMQQMSNVKNNSFELRIDKDMTDAQLKQDESDAKKFDFEVSFSGVKRNDKKEITAIKIAYKDKDGNSGNYNVGSDKPIAPISLTKQFDGSGKGNINIQSGKSKNNMFAGFGDDFGPGGFEMLFNDERFQNLDQDMFKGLLDKQQFAFTDKFGDLEKLREFQGFDGDSLGGNFKMFRFNDGEMQMDNPDMKLEEETEKDGMITKKYSDGKGNTMIFSEKKWSSDGKMDDLDKMKSDLGDQKKKIIIEKKIEKESAKSDLDNLKKELEKTKADLEKLKTDLQKDKGTKGKK
ncbi:hypothetical protein [Flavobacterium urocaniciphilum]|uniref:Uncharacterized protein n=1 Tax=Flavobacterium urocaniciphilum TaxID=1299341 RepID=A0A1H9CSM1_9FLAO|nr:hypothetical protein [Flavobacterium urocaniciphilum]SEQ04067.1 hypothetical protein SAMN05444005_10554 [Flavobacterium urocaniciphilum]